MQLIDIGVNLTNPSFDEKHQAVDRKSTRLNSSH